jgi:hypothetical protein
MNKWRTKKKQIKNIKKNLCKILKNFFHLKIKNIDKNATNKRLCLSDPSKITFALCGYWQFLDLINSMF